MIDNNHDSIRTSTIIYHFIRRFYAGCKLVISNFSSTLIYLFFLLLWCLLWIFKEEIFHLDDFMLSSSMLNSIYNIILILCFLFSNMLILVLLGTPSEFRHSQQALQKCGFVNHIGMAPILITRMPSSITPNASIWEFSCEGIPLDVWENKKIQIETALNISVISIRYSTGKQQILLTAVPAKADLPDQIEWKPQFLSLESFVLQLGQSLLGPVTVNLSHIPHILIGGSTGSGKSVLLKLLLMQCIHKGAKVYIADFKGGVDFPPIWHQKSEICTEEPDLFEILTDLVQELQQRKSAFKEAGVPNLDSYNQLCSKHLPRYIFACDEIAELLDRKESIS